MFKKHIAFKLITGFALIALISMLAIGSFFIQMFRQYTFQNTQTTLMKRAHSIADMLADYTGESGIMRGYGFIRFLDTMSEAKVWITDEKGKPAIFSGMGMGMGISPGHQFNSEPFPDEVKQVIEQVLKGQDSVTESFSSMYNETTLTVGVPILNQNKKVTGAVFLHAPVTGISATVNKAISILAVSLLAVLLPAFGLGVYYALQFTRPLQAMNRTALEMAHGNYDARTGIKREDELGQLGNSLDFLASKLGCTIDELFQEKGKISDIISSISEGLVAFDQNLKPSSINSALSEIMNRPLPYPLDLLEKDLVGLDITNQLSMVVKEKSSMQIVKDWMDKRIRFTLSPITNNSGNVTGSVALVQDISESERLEQFRKDFIANVSHEFRTPLTVIKGSLEALSDGTIIQPEDINRYHERMLAETRSLERLVADLLDLSLLQSGKILLNKEPVHLANLLEDAIKSLQTVADKKGIRIAYDSRASIPPVLGDYDRLRQLFVIFLDNAIKYSPNCTVITVQVILGQTLDITICDEGYGIPETALPYVWDRFYKTDNIRKSKGTGLGLAIAKHLIELHNGQVYLQSQLNKGTSVKISLPYETQFI